MSVDVFDDFHNNQLHHNDMEVSEEFMWGNAMGVIRNQ